MIYYFDSKNPKAPAQMGRILTDMVTQKILPHQEIVILCIGSDRSTGDSLGPIIGHQLEISFLLVSICLAILTSLFMLQILITVLNLCKKHLIILL